MHFLGGHTADVVGDRAITQTKMTINQRAEVDGVEVDVVCTGRFYDFCARHEGAWKIVRRQPIYEKDRLDLVDPSATLRLNGELLDRFPTGYRHLAYLQTKAGFTVKTGLPGLTGEVVQRLYEEGAKWLAGSSRRAPPTETPGAPPSAHGPGTSGPLIPGRRGARAAAAWRRWPACAAASLPTGGPRARSRP
ncbi:hypothetical protein [Streptomyces sp. NBC_00310]|uniref:hypothetical protein n=1 Tax=Streptomyces sp. NBC_00310 TaxID=2903645 RepID=UPI003FA736F3